MPRTIYVLVLSLLLAVPAGYSQAEDAKEKDTGEEPGLVDKATGYVGKATDYIDGAQGRATLGFGAFMTRVDGGF